MSYGITHYSTERVIKSRKELWRPKDASYRQIHLSILELQNEKNKKDKNRE